jgi:crossover junction endodeoxyribonuclease RuvC
MKILGIDPGIGRTGWGAIEAHGSKTLVRGFGCIETEVNSDTPGRLFALYDELNNLIVEYKPEVMAIEDLFFNKNVKTALIVGQARGVIMLAAVQHGLPISIYTPLQVKIALTGYGRAEKLQVGKMVKTLLNLPTIPKPDDVTDALAIAITHGFSAKMRNLK